MKHFTFYHEFKNKFFGILVGVSGNLFVRLSRKPANVNTA